MAAVTVAATEILLPALEGTATARFGRAWGRVPVWARIAVPVALAAGVYLGWLLAGNSAQVQALEPPDPGRLLTCFAGPSEQLRCVQGPGERPVATVEPGEVCGEGLFWMETGYAAVFGSEIRFRCVKPRPYDSPPPP